MRQASTTLLVLLLTLSACSSAPTPTTPPATCDSRTPPTPESWAPWQITATITPQDAEPPEAVPTVPIVQAIASAFSTTHPGDDPTAPRVWRCDGYAMLHLELTQTDQPPGTTLSSTLPRTPCTGDPITSSSGDGVLRLVERSSWCSEDLGGGSTPGFDGWWIDVTDAATGTYTWTRDITWTRRPPEPTDPTTPSPTPVERSGKVSVTAVLRP